ncbi:MAG: hypothetical protein ACRDAU_02275 [Clostridium sp.]
MQIEKNEVTSTESSTSSFSIPVSVTLNDSCYGLQINPVVHMSYTVNGQEGNYTIKLKPILATRKYSETVVPTLSESNGELGLNIFTANNGNASGPLVQLDPVNLVNGLNGEYLPKSYTFKLSQSDLSTTKFIPIKSPYLKNDGNGEYTISGPLLEQAYAENVNLFKIDYPNQPNTPNTTSALSKPHESSNQEGIGNSNGINNLGSAVKNTNSDIKNIENQSPKTGDTSEAPFIVLLAAAVAGLFGVNRKK